MPVISLITAVLAGKHQHIGDTWKSIAEQKLPEGWEFEWIVQEDGETGIPFEGLPTDDPRIVTGTGPHGRAGTARTLALTHATGVIVRAIDADDLFPDADTLARDITALIDNPSVSWCVSGTIDLLLDGTQKPGPRDPDPGLLPPDFLLEGARVGLLQVMATTFVGRTELVRALGGWQALPAGEEVGLMLAAEAVSQGLMLPKPGLLYRRWSGNSTAHVDKSQVHTGDPRVHQATVSRADAIKAAGWTWSPTPL